ncbi:hypothetical protein HaLaN_03604, partial [Haematococcus lacustris]
VAVVVATAMSGDKTSPGCSSWPQLHITTKAQALAQARKHDTASPVGYVSCERGCEAARLQVQIELRSPSTAIDPISMTPSIVQQSTGFDDPGENVRRCCDLQHDDMRRMYRYRLSWAAQSDMLFALQVVKWPEFCWAVPAP